MHIKIHLKHNVFSKLWLTINHVRHNKIGRHSGGNCNNDIIIRDVDDFCICIFLYRIQYAT